MERKIVDYQIVTGSVTDEYSQMDMRYFNRTVKDFIKAGWQPFGSVSTLLERGAVTDSVIYSQAMVKYED